jgi:essential nuclear protein 1
MPKVKKIRAAALTSLQVRQEPLGQVLEGDENKNKYAAPIRGGRKQKSNQEDEEFLDPKTSKKILDLTREQQLQMQAEEEQLHLRKNRREQQQQQQSVIDSDDEEEEEDIEQDSLEDDDE